MNTISASRAEPARLVLVWDAPLRVFHWLMAACFAGAFLTAESESWRLVHATLGYTFGALLVFRLVWGVVGPRHARFASFVRGPSAAWRYLRSLFGGTPEHHVGHNPAGALAMVALIALGLGVAATGIANYEDLAGEWAEELHEGLANTMLLLVGVHVAAALASSWLHRENLVAAMVTGRKRGTPADAIDRAWRGLAMLMVAGVLGFWWLQWRDAPARALEAPAAMARAQGGPDRDQARRHEDD